VCVCLSMHLGVSVYVCVFMCIGTVLRSKAILHAGQPPMVIKVRLFLTMRNALRRSTRTVHRRSRAR